MEMISLRQTSRKANGFILVLQDYGYYVTFGPFHSAQLLSHLRLFATPWTVARQASLSSPTPGVYSNSCPLSRDAIQPSHPLLSSSPPTFNPPQYQGLLKWVSSSHQVAKVLEFQLQHQSFQWIFRTDFL